MTLFIALLALWVLFNLLAPLSLYTTSKPLQLYSGAVARWEHIPRIRFRSYSGLKRGVACSMQLFWWRIVFIDELRVAMKRFAPDEIEALVAHEVGHCALGQMKWQLLMALLGVVHLPPAVRLQRHFEEEADAFAMRHVAPIAVLRMRARLCQA